MSHEADYGTLVRALADIECACENGEPGRGAALMPMFDRALRAAVGGGRLDAAQIRTLHEKARALASRLGSHRQALSEELAHVQQAGRATRAYLGSS